MRYTSDHKDQTRRKILDVASRRFRGEGVQAVGVASLMQSAGLTHGGFYAHFPSKEALVSEACAAALDQRMDLLRRVAGAAPRGGQLLALADAYLSVRHRDMPDQGCVVAAIGPEIARMPEVRSALTGRIEALTALVDACAREDGLAVDGRAFVGLLVGCLTLARTVEGEGSEAYLSAGRAAVRVLCAAARDTEPVGTKEKK